MLKPWTRRACGLLLLCLAGAAPLAQAEDLLSQISRKLAANSILHADFAQSRRMAALKKPLQLSGRMVLSRDSGVIWSIVKPYQLGYVMTPKGVSELLPDGSRRERASRDIPGIGSVEGLFRGLLAGDRNLLQQHFAVEAKGSAAAWTLSLTPKPGPLQKGLGAVELSGAAQLERVLLTEPGGDSTQIRFSRIDAQSPLSAEESRLLGGR
ncbi:outer membrane lipoprotein carrier protein LolA [Chromobacterium haemolyticum]|uniref:Outer membrane lipoprotein carrier protein LolA n=1 Tax=Chromobacterium haemolyticum TaxID=394935 RepID=A0ABS3GSG1_9NEIS|nr:outer membrane lipoprotein carrier protein LolA [Chromobacterium haemolyticum]MBK0416812.1 outer membrane lipoprotein carrier protein LolA [Chromobacterium haemolyticum]MBO0417990.1 outer membrane lipoprotein carrier protein LolA [Chromobacterium haemolyticum]MBO0501199.1 outer membrane lipoprotein carrier protein LolA [Chromobacterium haemolyticum]MDH0341120.1 outer membrane lipoprotein carrier protein LolA [Chromobacterium haemolyticum]